MSTTLVRKPGPEIGHCREVGDQVDEADRAVDLLAFLEEENKRLRDAVVDLCLEKFLLRGSTDF